MFVASRISFGWVVDGVPESTHPANPPPSSAGCLAVALISRADGAWMAAIAAGGLLAMPTDSHIPFAYDRAKERAGAATVLGLVLALGSL